LARCLDEESLQTPGLEEALRCELTRYQDDGRAWLDVCSVPHEPGDSSVWPQGAIDSCSTTEQLLQVIEKCASVGYCADGKRVSPGRCSGSPECADASDERGCFEFVGFDMAQCGDEITFPQWLCDSTCAKETKPPVCDEARPDRFLCADGTDVSRDVICNRKPDCADETDELYCLR
jgi:hypothetical protein